MRIVRREMQRQEQKEEARISYFVQVADPWVIVFPSTATTGIGILDWLVECLKGGITSKIRASANSSRGVLRFKHGDHRFPCMIVVFPWR
jgi:hypothetical protein